MASSARVLPPGLPPLPVEANRERNEFRSTQLLQLQEFRCLVAQAARPRVAHAAQPPIGQIEMVLRALLIPGASIGHRQEEAGAHVVERRVLEAPFQMWDALRPLT